MELLFELATWHSLAKLRLHDMDSTLPELKASTKRLGAIHRQFQSKVCGAYDTQDLPKEASAKARQKAAAGAKAQKTGKVSTSKASTSKAKLVGKGKGKKKRMLSLTTPKFHLLGHYNPYIIRVGTSDNFNSQTVFLH